jgi:hypothetical protein
MVFGHGTVNTRSQSFFSPLSWRYSETTQCTVNLLVISDCVGNYFAARVGSKEVTLTMLETCRTLGQVTHARAALLRPVPVVRLRLIMLHPMTRRVQRQVRHCPTGALLLSLPVASAKSMKKVIQLCSIVFRHS